MGCSDYNSESTCFSSGCGWCTAGCCQSGLTAGQTCYCPVTGGLVAWQIASIVIGVLFWIFICTCIIRCCRRRNAQTVIVTSTTTTAVVGAPYQNFNNQQQVQPMMGQPVYQQQAMMGQPMYQQAPPMMNGVQYSPVNQSGNSCGPNNTQFGTAPMYQQ